MKNQDHEHIRAIMTEIKTIDRGQKDAPLRRANNKKLALESVRVRQLASLWHSNFNVKCFKNNV